jgi:hypothetical protein
MLTHGAVASSGLKGGAQKSAGGAMANLDAVSLLDSTHMRTHAVAIAPTIAIPAR